MKKLLLAMAVILVLAQVAYTEGLQIGGYLTVTVTDTQGNVTTYGPFKNQIVNVGETALRDCFGGTGTPTCTPVQAWKYHGLGTSSASITEGDTGCTTELTTKYTGNVRATGSQTNNGANIYRTVATNTIDEAGAISIEEFCLFDQAATGGGTMWTRILTGSIAVDNGSAITTTYDLTID
jgi:hypothetical protein